MMNFFALYILGLLSIILLRLTQPRIMLKVMPDFTM